MDRLSLTKRPLTVRDAFPNRDRQGAVLYPVCSDYPRRLEYLFNVEINRAAAAGEVVFPVTISWLVIGFP